MTIVNGLTDGERRQHVAYALLKAGFNKVRATKFTAISWAECGCVEDAVGRFNTDGTVDRGCFQLNDKYQAACSDACAFEYACAARYVFKLFTKNGGAVYSAWHTYTSGRYLLHLPWATRAVRRAARQIAKEK